MKKVRNKKTAGSVKFPEKKFFSKERIEFNSLLWESWRRSKLLKDEAGNLWKHAGL